MAEVEKIKEAVKYLETLVEIRELLSKIDDKLEDMKFIMGAKAMS